LINSTLSGNGAGDDPGSGNGNGGGIFNSGMLSVTNCTISGNFALVSGGGITEVAGGVVIMKSTIVANNNFQPAGGNCASSGIFNSYGYNLSDDMTCSVVFNNFGDVNNIPAGLDSSLQNNGGPTQTIALLATSPAVDAIPVSPNACTTPDGTPITTDQRGISRPQGPACDIGAFELVPLPSCVTDLTGKGTPSGRAPARIDLTWTALSGADHYTVLRGTTIGGPYSPLGTATVPAFSDTSGLVNGGTYYYIVQPDTSTAEICQSNEAKVSIPSSGR
jgi:hypothetical protein